jgi:hypothetical protein
MARPLKRGLDYFPLDVNMDDSIELFEAECGLEGFAILIKLWSKIYSNGYFTDWTSDNQLLFSRRINSDPYKVLSIVDVCLKRGIFDKNLFTKHQVLTSKGIQKRYLAVCLAAKRKNIPFTKEYILLDETLIEETAAISELIHEKTPINSEETPIYSSDKYTKESKGNKSIIYPELFLKFYAMYPNPQEKNRTFVNWKSAIKTSTAEDLINAASNYKNATRDRDRQFMKSSANFLGKDKLFLDYIKTDEKPKQKFEKVIIEVFDRKEV